jgi:hypothetical protein
MKSLYRKALLTVICVVIVVGGTSGCASPAKSTGMTVNDAQIQKHHARSVKISVEGGSSSDPLGFPPVSNEAFAEAVANSIVGSKLFSEVKKGDGGDYLLNIHIFSIEQQPIGFNMTTHMEVGWDLVNAVTGKQVMHKTISSSYTATVGKAFAAVTRVRLATEGAAGKNIKEGIQEISKLDL